jgi:hypothetical protein
VLDRKRVLNERDAHSLSECFSARSDKCNDGYSGPAMYQIRNTSPIVSAAPDHYKYANFRKVDVDIATLSGALCQSVQSAGGGNDG